MNTGHDLYANNFQVVLQFSRDLKLNDPPSVPVNSNLVAHGNLGLEKYTLKL